MLEVDGRIAGDTGIYPQVKVQYSWKLCNYNKEKITLLDSPKLSYFQLWNGKTIKDDKYIVRQIFDDSTTLIGGVQKAFDDSTGLAAFEEGENCVSLTHIDTLDTSVATQFMSAQMQGLPDIKDNVNGDFPFCYAYAYNPISIKYGDCLSSVSAKGNL